MDGTGSTSMNVTSTTDPINIPAGGFKVYGNQNSIALDTNNILDQESFVIIPNPATDSFILNKDVESVAIYDITGKLISKFKGSITKGASFDVSEMKSGIYIVEVQNDFGQKMSSKLIKL
jgi:hypothetical protein